jgi:hypothetical protein
MSAGGKAAMLKGHPMNRTGLNWNGGALIRCIGWLGCHRYLMYPPAAGGLT